MVVAFRSNEITRYLPARAFLDFVFLASPTAWHSCSVAFWRREPDSTATSSVIPKPPFEARGVDDIMKLRKVCRAAAETTPSTTTTSPSPPEVAAPAPGASFSIQDKLEGLRPNSIRSWLEFRVSWLRGCYLLLCRHSSAEFVCTQVCDEVSSYTSREWKPISCHSRVAFNKSSFDNLSAAPMQTNVRHTQLQVVASTDHSERVDSSRSEHLLLDSICKQRLVFCFILTTQREGEQRYLALLYLLTRFDQPFVSKT